MSISVIEDSFFNFTLLYFTKVARDYGFWEDKGERKLRSPKLNLMPENVTVPVTTAEIKQVIVKLEQSDL
ncbi:hypothetical protein HC931_08450 [Candidatus Gracilibacteria bacterium]|jgi:hypothetical protein|nr:hypothetical protein [Candidatus Gracilibacteria bacterium]NJM86721.1 hypothetical protein [Hydrococcus sp. RU_2_2]NJP18322.1 hypothetical protein [Hydrococcus sp. CRU_1_1]